MKKILLLQLCLLYSLIINAQYCTPSYTAGCSLDAISNFSLKGESGTVIYNTSGTSCSIPYTDYTLSMPTVNLAIGNGYAGFLRTTFSQNYVSIWIDQNDNNIFESTERLLNNLQIGSTDLLYSITIPIGFTLGQHRMRVRNIYSANTPSTPTDPCTTYSHGETEDYRVNITNTPGARLVSNGIPGACMQTSKTTIDAASNNLIGYTMLLDSNNNLVAYVYPAGSTFNTVSANLYVHNGALRQAGNSNYYLNRNIHLNGNIPFTSTFNLRMFYKQSELSALIAQSGSGVSSQFDLTMYKNTDGCVSNLIDQSGTTIFPTGFGSMGGDLFLDFSGVTESNFNRGYYFSGLPLNNSCGIPLNPQTNLITATSGSFSWSPPSAGTPTAYEWAITSFSAPPGSGTSTTSLSVLFSGLTANALYYAHVRAICGSTTSNWQSIPFSTILNDGICNSTILNEGAVAICQNTENASSYNDPSICSPPNNTLWYQFTPNLTAPYTIRLTTPMSANPLYGVASIFTMNSPCPAVSLAQVPSSNCYQFGQSGSGDIDEYETPVLSSGTTYYIFIDGVNNDVGDFCISILPPPPPPLCTTNLLPLNNSVGIPLGTASASVDFSWNSSLNATGYYLYLDTVNPPVSSSFISSTNTSINFLQYNTTYYWYIVPTNYSGNASGCQSTISTFTTENPSNCIPLYGSGCSMGDSISYFSLKGESGTAIYNHSGDNCSVSPVAYSNYSGSIAPVLLGRGESYAGFIRSGNAANLVSIWIDQDDDGYFESDERLLNNLPTDYSYMDLLYSIYIPLSMNLGTHKMRVRSVKPTISPALLTSPCDYYEKGETEDYLVTIVNYTGIRNVALGTNGACAKSSTTTIDAASNNNNLPNIKLLDSTNNYICGIYPQGNNLGVIYADYYTQNTAPRLNANSQYYLNRDIHLIPNSQPTTPVAFRFFYTDAELGNLIAQSGSGVSSQFNLSSYQNQDLCFGSMNDLSGSFISPTGFGNYNGDKFVDLTNLNELKGMYLLSECLPINASSFVTACNNYTWNGNTYFTSGTYMGTFLSASGCDSSHTLNLTIVPSSLVPGNATLTPNNVCVGSNITLQYQIPCAIQNGFAGQYDPTNWALSDLGNSNGFIDPSFSPTYINMYSSDGLSGAGATRWEITPTCSGTISFDWEYSTSDGSQYDYPRYSINGASPLPFPGYSTLGSNFQTGTASISVIGGQSFIIDVYSIDNLNGGCNVLISNFSGPSYQSNQSIHWYSNLTGGATLGDGLSFTVNTNTAGNITYYAEPYDSIAGCVLGDRIATNSITVNANPSVETSVSNASICVGQSTSITGTGATSYTWEPGNLSGSPINVSPATTTTYTVTGTNSNGCTATTTRLITVNTNPSVGTSVSNASICVGQSTSITGTGATSYTWEPGNLSGSPINVSPATTTTYTVTGTNSNGCTATTTRLITVNTNPSVGTSVSNASICVGQSTSITGTGATSYTWQPGNLSGSPINVSPATTTTYTVTGTNSAGCTATTTRLITVNTNPSVGTSVSNASICVGQSTSITGIGATSYTWQPGNLSGSPINVSPATTTTYTVTGTNSFGCTATTTRLITVNTNPSVGTSVSNASICVGQSTSITGTGATSYTWQPGNLSGSPINVSPATTTTYTVIGTNSAGCTATTTRLITVNTNPSVGTSVSNASICVGQSTSITGTGATSYTWEPGNLSGSPINVSPATTTTYTVTGTNSAGCTATTTRLITVNTNPSVGTSVSNASICVGQSTSITGTGATSYTWQPGNLSGSPINVSPATTTTYTVTGTNIAGCTASTTRLITVNTNPSVGTSVTNASICVGQSTSITGTGATSYTWEPGNLSGSPINVSPAITTTYTVTGTNSAGCTATTTRLITVNTNPSVGTSVSNASICVGQSTSITGTGATSYTWQPGNLSGSPINVSPAITTTYTVTGTNSAGCTATTTRLITVNTNPSVGTSVSNASICVGQSTSITGTGATSYTWEPGNLSGSLINVSPAITTTYTVIGTNSAGCTATTTRLITVNTNPSVGTSVSNASICVGQSTSITGTGATSYTWEPGNLSGSPINVSPAITTTYTVTGTNSFGCTATTTRLITVNTNPSVGTSVTNASICVGQSTSITGTGATSYTWEPGNLSGSPINVSPATTTTYTVTGTNSAGCTASTTRLITVNACGNSILTVKLFIQGYYTGAGTMTTVLANEGIGSSPSNVDTIIIELSNPSSPFAIAHSYQGILQTNGNIECTFPGSIIGNNYYIVARHRNSIETWSSNPVLFQSNTSYDFSTAVTKAYGDNQIEVEPTIWALYSGDINQDGAIDAFDYIELDPDIINGESGYLTTDLTGDGVVDAFDYILLDPNLINGIGVIVP